MPDLLDSGESTESSQFSRKVSAGVLIFEVRDLNLKMKRDPKKGKSCRRANQTSHLVINDGDFEFEKVYFRDHYSIDLGSFFSRQKRTYSPMKRRFSVC